MAALTEKVYRSFIKGLVTEASPLTFPENASIDEQNFVLNRDGSRSRRLGIDYEAMDTESIIASALDIVADESTLKNENGEVLQIKSPDENLQRILYNLFYDVLNIEFNLWLWIRNMCKYGDFYLYLQIAEKFGIYGAIPLSVYDMVREEGLDPANPSYVCFKIDPMVIAAGGINSRVKDRDGKKIRVKEIEKMWGIGTPEDLNYYLENN